MSVEEDFYDLHYGTGQTLKRGSLFVGPRHLFGYSSNTTHLSTRPLPLWYRHLGHGDRMSQVLKHHELEMLEDSLSLISLYRGPKGFSHSHSYCRHATVFGAKEHDGLTIVPAGNFYDALQSSIDMVSLLPEDDLPRVLCMNWVPPEVKLVIQHRLEGKKDGLQ